MVRTIIEDGTGKGYKARVNPENMLDVMAISETYLQHISDIHELAFVVPLGTAALPTVTVTATGGYMMYVKNTSTDYPAVMGRISVATSASMEIVVVKNPIIGALVNEVEITAVNKNFASGKAMDIEAYGWDEVGDQITGITAGDVLATYLVNGFERVMLDEAVILGVNNVIAVKAKGVGELALNAHGYYLITTH